MRSITCFMLFFLFLLPMSVSLGIQPRTGFLEGYVLDDARMPIAHATVEVRNILHGQFAKTTADESGFYQFADLPIGKYTLWAEAKGHCSEWMPEVIIEENEHTRRDIRLIRDNIWPGTLVRPAVNDTEITF